jgi:hypothetical protein
MSRIPYRRPEGDVRAKKVASLVRRIAANRRALLLHRGISPDLGRVVKDPWKTGPAVIDSRALVASFPAKDTVSVRLDPSLALTVASTPIGKPRRRDPTTLEFVHARKVTATLTGAKERLDLVEELLGGKAPTDLAGLLLPRDLGAFERLARARAAEVQRLLDHGRGLVEEVERLVCALYDVPAELTEEVVEHAVRRASASA